MPRADVIKIPVPGEQGPGATQGYVYISARLPRDITEACGADVVVSFVLDTGTVAVEWEPKFGPLQLWFRAPDDDETADDSYVWPKHRTPPLSWSQTAVDKEGLPEALARGDLAYVFSVLRRWAESRSGRSTIVNAAAPVAAGE